MYCLNLPYRLRMFDAYTYIYSGMHIFGVCFLPSLHNFWSVKLIHSKAFWLRLAALINSYLTCFDECAIILHASEITLPTYYICVPLPAFLGQEQSDGSPRADYAWVLERGLGPMGCFEGMFAATAHSEQGRLFEGGMSMTFECTHLLLWMLAVPCIMRECSSEVGNTFLMINKISSNCSLVTHNKHKSAHTSRCVMCIVCYWQHVHTAHMQAGQ